MNFHHTILIRTNIPNGNREMLSYGAVKLYRCLFRGKCKSSQPCIGKFHLAESFSKTAKIVVAHLEGKRSNGKFIDS